MKPPFLSRKGLRQGIIVSLMVVGTGLIVVQLLRAQPADASPGSPPAATNSSTAQGNTNAASPSPAPQGETNAPIVPGTTNQTNAISEVPPPGEMAGPAEQNTTNNPSEGLPQEIPNSPAVQNMTNPSNGTSEGVSQEIPNSPAVQDITNQTGFWDSLWQQGSPLHFGLTVGETYDDNILISPNKTSSFLTHIAPSIDFQKGDQTAPDMNYLNLYFSPTVYLYQNHSDDNRINYNGDIYYQHSWTRLTLGFEQQYQYLTDPSLDFGTLVSRNIYTTKLTAYYYYNDHLSLYETGTQQINSYPGTTIDEWDSDTYALYQVAPKLLLGVGPRFAFINITGAPSETHQDLLVRLKYSLGTKLSTGFAGGVEYLQYQDNMPSRLLPIFNASITYMPFDGTGLFLSAGRETLNSYDIEGDTIDYTYVQAGVSQRFLQDVNFTLTLGYHMSDYQAGSGQTENGTQRNDDYYYAKGGVEWDPQLWLKVEASYQWSENNSTFAQDTFSDNQIDVQSSVQF
jgi:hypothetical protein